jgi:capsular polysaccharide biosynthesis protein
VDFAAFDFDKQLNISRATDVLVAMHGAGLAQMMFQHVWGGVFEFFCPEKPSSNYRYHQLANKMGLRYGSYSIGNEKNEVPIAEVMPQLRKLAEEVADAKRTALRNA